MRTTLTAGLAAAVLVLAACGSDDSSPSGDQGEVADLLMEAAGDEGFELDRDCVNEKAGELSNDDAKALAEAGLEGDAEISAAGDAIGEAIFSECVDASSYLNALIESFGEDDPTLDTDCLRSALEGKTVDEIDEGLFDAAFECTTDG